MKGSRLSEEQIIGSLREHEAGAKTEEVCRRHEISGATFYKWKAKFGGLAVLEARRLMSLEDENRRLKMLLAESMLDNAALEEPARKRRLRLALERQAMGRVMERHGLSQRHACGLVGRMLAREGYAMKHKKLYRLYYEERLMVRRAEGASAR